MSTEDSSLNAPGGADGALERAVLVALDGLLRALELEPRGDDHFRVVSEPGRFDQVFGGQTIAQALLAASATVTGKDPQSLHAYFVDAGTPEQPLDLAVDRVRDGRSTATRRVTVTQGGRPLVIAIASFHTNPTSPELANPPPSVPRPDQLPMLQDWVHSLPAEMRVRARTWVDRPPPLELRIGEAPNFLGGAPADGTRSHWMRVPRDVGDDPLLHTALLAYASDYLLLDMAFRSYPERVADTRFTGSSLDHTLWFHRPVHFDHWHLHSQETLAVVGHRGLVQGAIYDADGHLVASAAQEVLVRPARSSRRYGEPSMTSIPHRLFQQRWPEGEYRLFQLGFVVDDLLGTAARWAGVFGVGPFHVLPPIEQPCTYRGNASGVNVQVAIAQAGPVQIELIKQHCDRASVYRDLVEQGESGFHQLCTVTPDYEETKAHYEQLGYEPVSEMVARGQHIAFFDTLDDFGFFTEVAEEIPGFLTSLEQIAQTCADWDGTDPIRILTRDGYRTP